MPRGSHCPRVVTASEQNDWDVIDGDDANLILNHDLASHQITT